MDRDTRTGYGCLAVIVIPIAVIGGYIFFNDWRIRKEIEKEQAISQSPSPVRADPFSPATIVYSWQPPGNILGGQLKVVPCSEYYQEAYDLMLQESDTDYKVAVSLGNQLFHKDYTPESEYKKAYSEYILDKQQQKRLLFMPTDFKMQIIQKKYDGDPPHRSIYECKVLQEGSEGITVYIQAEYITRKSE